MLVQTANAEDAHAAQLTTCAGLRVAFVTPGWPPEHHRNGIVAYTSAVREGLQQLGARAFVIAYELEPQWADPDVVRLHSCSRQERPATRVVDKVWRRLARDHWTKRVIGSAILKRICRLHRDAGLQLLQMEETWGWADFVARRSPVPVVVRMHGPWFLVGPAVGEPQEGKFQRRLRAEGKSFASAHGVFSAAHFTLDQARRWYGLKLPHAEVIPNAVAPVPPGDRWCLEKCGPGRILFVGRFDRVKGGDVVIEALAQVLKVEPDATLTLVGPDVGLGLFRGPGDRWSAEAFVNHVLPDQALRRQVKLLGPRSTSEIMALRRSSMVTVVASRFENFPNVALEAMAQGCPVIATNVGGIPEMIQHERNGLLCAVADSGDLATKILSLLRDPKLCARLGEQAAIDTEQRYHPDMIAKRTLDFYRRVIERWEKSRSGRKRGWSRRWT